MIAADEVAIAHLVQDLRANLHTAPEPHRTLMRRAADELARFQHFLPIETLSIPIPPPEEQQLCD